MPFGGLFRDNDGLISPLQGLICLGEGGSQGELGPSFSGSFPG